MVSPAHGAWLRYSSRLDWRRNDAAPASAHTRIPSCATRSGPVLGGAWALWHVPLFCSAGSVLSVPVLHTAVNAWSSVIPVMVTPDGSSLRPFEWVVIALVFAAVLLLFFAGPKPQFGSVAPQARP